MNFALNDGLTVKCGLKGCETRRIMESSLRNKDFSTVLRKLPLTFPKPNWTQKLTLWLLSLAFVVWLLEKLGKDKRWAFENSGVFKLDPEEMWRKARAYSNSLQFTCCDKIVLTAKTAEGIEMHRNVAKIFAEFNQIYIVHVAMNSSRTRIFGEVTRILMRELPLSKSKSLAFQLMSAMGSPTEETEEFLRTEPDFDCLSTEPRFEHMVSYQNSRLARDYWTQAEHNLRTARAMGPECGSNAVVFMVHQAVELALKGLIISENGTAEEIHSLSKISLNVSRLEGVDGSLGRVVREFEERSKAYHTRLRYPFGKEAIPHLLYNHRHRSLALEYGERILGLLRPHS